MKKQPVMIEIQPGVFVWDFVNMPDWQKKEIAKLQQGLLIRNMQTGTCKFDAFFEEAA